MDIDEAEQSSDDQASVLATVERRLQFKLAAMDIQREVRERFGYGFEHSATPMMVTTILGELVNVNDCFCRALGRTRDELMTCDLLTLLHSEDQKLSFDWGTEATMEGRDEFAVELRYAHADGHWVHFALTSRTIRDDEGDALYFFTQLIDISELKEAQRELAEYARELEDANLRLVEAAKTKTRFLATTSHDLRSPLTVIHGYASMLAINPGIDEQTRTRYLEMVLQQTNRMDRMMEDLLLVSRIDSGKVASRPEILDAGELARELVASITGHEDESAHIEVDAPGPFPVFVDRTHLERSLSNLVSNAIKYGSAPYAVRVKAIEDQVRIEVADSGPGVPAEFTADMFEPFSRASRQSEVKGTGLGLAIVRGLARSWGGEASCKRVGDETRFTLTLPRHKA